MERGKGKEKGKQERERKGGREKLKRGKVCVREGETERDTKKGENLY